MTRFPGADSGPCFAALRFPWPLPFPPRPPRPVARVCSAASLVLWAGLTSLDRASADYGLSLAAAAWRKCAQRSRDLPVSVWMVSRRAWGLGPRGASVHLALTVPAVLPSAFPYSVGALDIQHFAAQYPARRFPCQRFAASRATPHELGAVVGGYPFNVQLFHSHPSTGLPARRECSTPVPFAPPATPSIRLCSA